MVTHVKEIVELAELRAVDAVTDVIVINHVLMVAQTRAQIQTEKIYVNVTRLHHVAQTLVQETLVLGARMMIV